MSRDKATQATTRRLIDLTLDDLVDTIDERLGAHLTSLASPGNDDLLDRAGAAKFLGVSVAQLDKLIREQALPYHRVGDSKRFERAAVLAWVKRPRTEAGDS